MPRAATKRLVAGHGRYLDDISIKGEYYAAFLRSPYPHASFASQILPRPRLIPGSFGF
jgi:carbon-monoxide dehydrogenase large subunit